MKLDTIGAKVHERWKKPSCDFIHSTYNIQTLNNQDLTRHLINHLNRHLSTNIDNTFYQSIVVDYDDRISNVTDNRYNYDPIIDLVWDIETVNRHNLENNN